MAEQEINHNRYSFFDLFNSEKNKNATYILSIPKIQRDYAQGRTSSAASEIRKEFLEKLHEYMVSPGIHDLDFVYGTTEDGKFIPLDGQQRLTTLFLIHWYLAKQCEGSDVSKKFTDCLTINNGDVKYCKFIYETRSSASEFSDALMTEDISFKDLKKVNSSRVEEKKTALSISEYIRDKSWYIPDWKFDPTIQSMLVMIDAIDNELKCEADAEGILTNLMSDDSPITFIFRNLDDYGLTDDLYIKMNSRGKPLTDFENFKAKFGQEVERLSSHPIFDGLKEKINDEKAITGIDSVKEYFSFNIDTKWTNLIWAYCHEDITKAKAKDESAKGKNAFESQEKILENLLDGKMARLIKMTLSLAFAFYQQREIPSELMPSDKISYKGLCSAGAITAQHIEYLIKVFDLFSNGMEKIKCVMKYIAEEKVYFDESKVFSDILDGNDIGFAMRVRLWAYIQYRLTFGDKTEHLNEWMKFIYNITTRFNGKDILNSNIFEAISDLSVFIKAMKENETCSISSALVNGCIKTGDFFEDYQIKEERIKAKLCLSERFKERIDQLESHPYFNGQIGFIIKLAGIWDIEGTTPIDEFLELSAPLYDKLDKYGLIAETIFDGGYENRTLSGEAVFERALLTQTMYYSSASGNFFNTTSKVGNIRRDNSWKRYLREFESSSWALDAVSRLFVKIYSDNNPNNAQDVVASLNAAIEAFPKELTERSLLINYSYIMEGSRNGFFSHYDDENLILHDWLSYSKNDWEIFSIVLWFEGFCKEYELKPEYSDFYYRSLNCVREEDLPHVEVKIGTESGDITFSTYAESCDGQGKYYLWVDISEINSESRIFEPIVEMVKKTGYNSENNENTKFSKNLTENGVDFATTAEDILSEYTVLKEKINSIQSVNEQSAE